MMPTATLGGSTGAQNSVAMMLTDHATPTPPWGGAKAVLGRGLCRWRSKRQGGAVRRLDVAPTFDPDAFAALKYDAPAPEL